MENSMENMHNDVRMWKVNKTNDQLKKHFRKGCCPEINHRGRRLQYCASWLHDCLSKLFKYFKHRTRTGESSLIGPLLRQSRLLLGYYWFVIIRSNHTKMVSKNTHVLPLLKQVWVSCTCVYVLNYPILKGPFDGYHAFDMTSTLHSDLKRARFL